MSPRLEQVGKRSADRGGVGWLANHRNTWESPFRVDHFVTRTEEKRHVPLGEGFPARVLDTFFHGHDASISLMVTCPGEVRLPVVCRTQGELPEGDSVGVRIVGPVSWYPHAA